MAPTLKIDCYLSMGCASEVFLGQNIENALKLEGTDADVRFHRLSESDAAELSFRGSPAILINGTDIFPREALGFS